MSDPEISVILTAHNRKAFLMEAIRSVLDQTLERSRYEIVLVKNFYDEEIDSILKEEGAKNIFLEDAAMGRKLLAGLKNSSGRIISFLDDDDMFHRKKLERVLQIFENDEDVVFYHNAIRTVDVNGKVLGESYLKNPTERIAIKTPQENLKSVLRAIKAGAHYNTSSMVMDRNILLEHADRLMTVLAVTDSYLFHSALLSNKKIVVDSEKLTDYRVHKSTSNIVGNIDAFVEESKVLYEKYVHDYRIIDEMLSNSVFNELSHCSLLENSAALSIIDPDFRQPVSGTPVCSLLKCAATLKRYDLVRLAYFLLVNHLDNSHAQSLFHRDRVEFLRKFYMR